MFNHRNDGTYVRESYDMNHGSHRTIIQYNLYKWISVFWHINIVQRVIRLFFDLLHGIKRRDVPLMMVLEFLVFLGFDGKLELNSNMEKDLFLSTVDQLKERFNTLVWILCKITLKKLCNFWILESENKNDKARECTYLALSKNMGKIWWSCDWRKRPLEFWCRRFGNSYQKCCVSRIRYPKESEATDRVQALTDSIMEKFDQDRSAFSEWSATIHSEYIADHPTTSQQQHSSPTVVEKICEWDPGKYLRL